MHGDAPLKQYNKKFENMKMELGRHILKSFKN